jgi:hypothetical protein
MSFHQAGGIERGMQQALTTVRASINLRSPALAAAFDLLMAHAAAAGFAVEPDPEAVNAAVIRSARVTDPAFSLRLRADGIELSTKASATSTNGTLDHRGAAGPESRDGRGAFGIADCADVDATLAALRQRHLWPTHRAAKRFPAGTFAPVSAQHLLRAARSLLRGGDGHLFHRSTDYDVVVDGRRMAPKALFGLAATEALGFPVRPENFVGGKDTPCFRLLREHGYQIVPKGEPIDGGDGQTSEDHLWTEGKPTLVTHLRRERATGLAAAKREEMRAKLGRLVCQRCGFDPVAAFGSPVGEACIEVHHSATPVAEMNPNHPTSLRDLECLCANCHRVAHRQFKIACAFS